MSRPHQGQNFTCNPPSREVGRACGVCASKLQKAMKSSFMNGLWEFPYHQAMSRRSISCCEFRAFRLQRPRLVSRTSARLDRMTTAAVLASWAKRTRNPQYRRSEGTFVLAKRRFLRYVMIPSPPSPRIIMRFSSIRATAKTRRAEEWFWRVVFAGVVFDFLYLGWLAVRLLRAE